jgi:putative ABC transport system permease protein
MNLRLSARARKSLSDVLRRKAHSIVIVLAILIPVGGFTAVSVATDSLSSAYAFSLGAHGTSQETVVAIDRSDSSLLAAIARQHDVASAQLATVLQTQWYVSAAPGHVSFRVVGYPDLRHVPLTPFQLLAGRYPGRGEIVIDYGDRGLQPVGLGDRVTLDSAGGTVSLRVVGVARTPGTNPATTGIGSGYMSSAALDRIPAHQFAAGDAVQPQPFRSQELTLDLHSPADFQATVRALGPVLRAHHATVLAVSPPAHGAPVDQLKGILSLIRVLLAVALLLAAILIMNAVSALVARQTTVIATMKALGATRATVVKGYATTVLIYSLVATPLGIALGVIVGGKLASAMARSIPLAPGAVVVAPSAIAVALAVGFAVPLLAALVPLWLGTRVTVKEALTGWGVSSVEAKTRAPARRLLTARLLDRVPQTVWLGLRGLFRKPWQAAISIVTVAIAAACFLVVQSLASSVNGSIGAVWGSFKADTEVYVGGQRSFRQISALLAHVPNIARIERVGWFGSDTRWGKVSVWGIEPSSQIYVRPLTSGRWFTIHDSHVLLVSDDLASRAHLHTGGTISVPGPGGARSMSFTVIGTVHEPVDDLSQVGAIDMPVNDLYRLEGAPNAHIDNYTTRVLVQARDRSPAAVDRLTRTIDAVGRRTGADRQGPVSEVFSFHDEVVRQQRNFLPVYTLLLVVAIAVAAVGALGLADALGASVIERRRDIGLLRSLGASGRRVATVFWIEAAALSAIAWLLASALGIPLVYLFVQLFRDRVMPTDVHFDPLALAGMVAVTFALATVATIVPAQRAAALRPGDLLRGE